MRISLDVEGTLADVHDVVLPKLEREIGTEIDMENIRWNLQNSPVSLDTYLEHARNVWRFLWREIPPVENDLSYSISRIEKMNGVDIDIVTSRKNSKKMIEKWLEMNWIPYEKYVIASEKFRLDYDIFIDDNPELAGKVNLILYDQPWNRDIDDEEIIARIGEGKSFQDVPEILKEMKTE